MTFTVHMKTKTKYLEDPTYMLYFLGSRGFKDITF